jgi:hypothetical protein
LDPLKQKQNEKEMIGYYFLLFARIIDAMTIIKTINTTSNVKTGNSGTEGIGVEPKMLVSIMLYE